MMRDITDLQIQANKRIPVTVADRFGQILSTGSKIVKSYSVSINDDLVIPHRSTTLPDMPKHHLFIVMHFADQKFAFTCYRGNPSSFVAAPKHQRGYDTFDGQEYRNSFHDRNIAERIRRSHWTLTNGGQAHEQRPVMVTIVPFENVNDRDIFAARFIGDIDLSKNLNCLNHRSYTWAKPELKTPKNTNGGNKERRKVAKRVREAEIVRQTVNDASIYKIFNIASFVVSKGTRADLATMNRITLADINDIVAGEMRRNWKLYSKEAERQAMAVRCANSVLKHSKH